MPARGWGEASSTSPVDNVKVATIAAAAAAAAGVEVEVEFGAPRPVAATASVPLTGIASWTNIWQTYVSLMPFPPNGQRAPFRRSRDAGVLLFLKSNVGNSNGMG